MKMFKFTKSFVQNNETKLATNYNKIDDTKRIEQIRERMYPQNNNIDESPINAPESETNKMIYRDRINAMKNIKKD